MNDKVTIVIPSRNETFLPHTIKDLLKHAEGDVEIIAILDGYWPKPDEIVNDARVHYLHRGEAQGMRKGITSAVDIATGKYIMKIDAHCMVDQGFDTKLKADCEPNWVVIPRRKRLDAENWAIQDVGKPDIDYMFLSFPNDPNDWGGKGLNGKIWTDKIRRIGDDPAKLIDDEMSFQGSCWFMHRDYFYELELMDSDNYGAFWNEAQEIGCKAWLSGGAVKRNKKTWYAHLHKGKKYGRGYRLPEDWLTKGASYTRGWAYNEAWDKQTIPFEWLIEHFWPVPTWPENWQDILYKERQPKKI